MTFISNNTGSVNTLTQTLCQLSGGCQDSFTRHTASSVEVRPRFQMSKRCQVTSSKPSQPGQTFFPMSYIISPHWCYLTICCIIAQFFCFFSSLLIFLRPEMSFILLNISCAVHILPTFASGTIFSWKFPSSKVGHRLVIL